MITNIEMIPGTLPAEKMFFRETDLTLMPNPRIIPLFGPNGSGKTTLLDAVGKSLAAIAACEKEKGDTDPSFRKEYLDRALRREGCRLSFDGRPFRFLQYANGRDNFRGRQARTYAEAFDPGLLAARYAAQSLSEGQSIVYSVFDLFDLMGTGKKSVRIEGTDLIVLIDELDSGLSVDNLDMFMRKLKRAAGRRDDLQVIFSFNNPRVLACFPWCLSMYEGKPVKLQSTDDMLAQFKEHEKEFNRKRKRSDGRPKVYDD